MRFRALILIASIGLANRAHAFADSTQFFSSAALPHIATVGASSEGIYFTGAPRFAGQTCAACHVDGPGQIGVKVGADLTALFSTGYQPGHTYALEVDLQDEIEGLSHTGSTCTAAPTSLQHFTYVQCNNNNYALEIDTPVGPLTGSFCAAAPVNGKCPDPNPATDESLVAPGDDAIFGNRAYSAQANMSYLVVRNDPRSWHLWWTAPPAGTGPLTLRVAVVDGNGGSGTAANDQDPYNDDTVQAAIPISEAGFGARSAAPACAYGASGTEPGPLAIVLALCGVALAQRRRLGRAASALVTYRS